jgi:inorganic pyrophosphatase
MDHATGRIRLDRMLFTSTRYPADYGYLAAAASDQGYGAYLLVRQITFPDLPPRERA